MADAVVVGAGPNGLAAAVALAERGVRVSVLESAGEIGGGTRSGELTVPGVLHDHCSAVHPMGYGSPFLQRLDLAAHGLRWAWPEIELAHPLDGGREAALLRSITETAHGLGADGHRWERLFGPLAHDFDELATDIFRPIMHVPKHPLRLARFGVPALLPANLLAKLWRGEQARALFAGLAAHAFRPLSSPASPGIGLFMGAAGHRGGWPVAVDGSRSITAALASVLAKHGGTIETGVTVRSMAELPSADVTLLDLTPRVVAGLLGERMPGRIRRAYQRYRPAPAAFKLDLAVEGGVPWRGQACRNAGTVHVGGTIAEIAHAEREVHRGRMPERPFILVAQQYLADPGRSAGDIHPVDTYAHVPHGYPGDATEAILAQLERFAPGLRERIVGQHSSSPADLARYNASNAGGDIIAGANTPLRMVMRPRTALDPYRTGVPGVFLCSAATPPGAGVHGMCGYNAAQSALRYLSRRRP